MGRRREEWRSGETGEKEKIRREGMRIERNEESRDRRVGRRREVEKERMEKGGEREKIKMGRGEVRGE